MKPCHVTLELRPVAYCLSAHWAGGLPVILFKRVHALAAALLGQQPLLVHLPLLAVRPLSVSGHELVIGVLPLAVRASGRAAQGLVVLGCNSIDILGYPPNLTFETCLNF